MRTAKTAIGRFRAMGGKTALALAGAALIFGLSLAPASAESIYHEPLVGPAFVYPYAAYPYPAYPYPAYAYAYPSYPAPYYAPYPYYGYYGPAYSYGYGPRFGVFIRRR